MPVLCVLCFLTLLSQAASSSAVEPEQLFQNGQTWEQFFGSIARQRELWQATDAAVSVPPEFIERVKGASQGLRILVVAEDWCPDSALAVPHVARMASAAGVPLRVVDRAAGETLMAGHRTPDGRTATPTIVLLRNGIDAGAWVERPAELQSMFLSMSTNPENAKRFSQRRTWYESDGGLSTLREIVALIEQTRDKE